MKKLIAYYFAALAALSVGILSLHASVQAQPVQYHSPASHPGTNTQPANPQLQMVQYYPDRRYNNHRYNRHPHWGGPRYQPYYRPAPPPRYYPKRNYRSGRNAHINWCYNRYRSYRASDNSFQPYNGPRRQCYSPYI